MDILLIVATAIVLTAAGYAQHQVSRYTKGAGRILLIRSILIITGIAFGAVMAKFYFAETVPALLVFLGGFGLVHVPAAVILFIKRERGETKT